MGSLIDRVLMAYRPLYLRGLLMDGQYRLLPAPQVRPETPASGLAAVLAIAAAARRPTQGTSR